MMADTLNILLFTIGLAGFLAGIYLWLGLAAALIVLGLTLMFVAVRLEITGGKDEPTQATDTVHIP